MKSAALILALAVRTFAQVPIDPPALPSGSVVLGLGAEYNRYANPRWLSTIDFGIQLPGTKVFSLTTLETPFQRQALPDLRTGFGYLFKYDKRVALILYMDAGAVGSTWGPGTAVLGNVGGGILVRWDLGHSVGLVVGLRETAVAGQTVSPQALVKLSYYLK